MVEVKQVQEKEARGSDGSFVHHKALIHLFTYSFTQYSDTSARGDILC